MKKTLKIWILHDKHKIGTQRQCETVLNMLKETYSLSFEFIEISLPKFLQFLPTFFGKFLKPKFFSSKLTQAHPDIIIVGGRRSVMAFLSMKFRGCSIAVLNPRIRVSKFNIVIAPHHDQIRGENVIPIIGGLHQLKPSLLSQAYPQNTKPFIAVMLGGNTKYYRYKLNDAENIVKHMINLRSFINPKAMFHITASRRTPSFIIEHIKKLLYKENFEFWNGIGNNPYHYYITHASSILVTSDSINMVTEACIFGKPTYFYQLPIKSKKFHIFLNYMTKHQHCSNIEILRTENWFIPLNNYENIQKQLNKKIAPYICTD